MVLAIDSEDECFSMGDKTEVVFSKDPYTLEDIDRVNSALETIDLGLPFKEGVVKREINVSQVGGYLAYYITEYQLGLGDSERRIEQELIPVRDALYFQSEGDYKLKPLKFA